MSQYYPGIIDPLVKDGDGLAADLNALIPALLSSHSGTTRPSYVVANMLWIKTGTAVNENQLCYFDGTEDIVVGTFNTNTNSFTANVAGTFNAETDLFTTTSSSIYPLIKVTSMDIDDLDIELGGVGQAAGKDFTYNPSLRQVSFVSPPPVGISLRVRGGAMSGGGGGGGTADLTNVTGILAKANGGTGTSTPSLVQGTNVTITGSWPNQTINFSGSTDFQSKILFQDEGVSLGTTGTVDTINFTGSGVTASRTGNALTVNCVTGGGSGTVTSVGIIQPAAGITASGGPITASGSITLALADDLAAVEGIASTGFVRRTAANTWSAAALVASEINDSTSTGRSVLTAATALAARTAIAAANEEQPLILALSDETTALTTGTAKITFRAPFAMTLTQIPRISVNTASTSGLVTVDIKESGTTVLGANKLTIDVNEKTSVTAATPTTLVDTSIADDAELTFDITVAGTGAKGLKVVLYYKRT